MHAASSPSVKYSSNPHGRNQPTSSAATVPYHAGMPCQLRAAARHQQHQLRWFAQPDRQHASGSGPAPSVGASDTHAGLGSTSSSLEPAHRGAGLRWRRRRQQTPPCGGHRSWVRGVRSGERAAAGGRRRGRAGQCRDAGRTVRCMAHPAGTGCGARHQGVRPAATHCTQPRHCAPLTRRTVRLASCGPLRARGIIMPSWRAPCQPPAQPHTTRPQVLA